MDLLLLVDASGSVRDHQQPNQPDNWVTTKNFVQGVIRTGTRVHRHRDRIALILFSSTASVVFDFNRYNSQNDVLDAVERLRFIGSTTNTSLALDLARRVFQDPKYGSRRTATHIMLLITDLWIHPDPTWSRLYQGNVSLISTTTNIKRFRKYYRCIDIHKIQTVITDVRGVCPLVCQSVCHAAQLCVVHSCSLCQISLPLVVSRTPCDQTQLEWPLR